MFFVFLDRSYGKQEQKHTEFFQDIKNNISDKNNLKIVYIGVNSEKTDNPIIKYF